jgi:tetratricopeptide (TPR) repeat protein
LSAYAVAQANYSDAHAHASSAVELARRLNDRSAEAWGLTYQGHIWLETGLAKEAEETYTASLAIRRELDQPVLALEPLAGLALAALAQGRPTESLQHVETIMAHLKQGSLEGTDEPVRIYLACYRCLLATEDPRAGEVLENCYRFLQDRASKIQDETARRLFLENIPAHRELMRIARTVGLSADPTNRRIT